METISVRMNTAELKYLTKVLDQPQSELIRDLVKEGKQMRALELYKQKKASLGLAAKIAGVPLGAFLDLLKEFNINLNMELEDAKAALRYAREVMK